MHHYLNTPTAAVDLADQHRTQLARHALVIDRARLERRPFLGQQRLPRGEYGTFALVADASGARAAFAHLAPSGLHRVAGTLPSSSGGRIYAHLDSVNGVGELALAEQFRQANVISHVMIVGTPGMTTLANLAATADRQAMRVAQALPA